MPEKDDRIDFKNFDKQYKTEVMGFYDLECGLAPEAEVKECPDCIFNCKCPNSFTIEKNKHHPVIYAYCLVSSDGKLLKEKSKYCPDGDAHVQLLEELLKIEHEIKAVSNQFIPMERLKPDERERLLKSQKNQCNHCKIEFKIGDIIVQDHHPFSGIIY